MNMKFIKRATTAILAAVMCLSFSSCGDTSYIAKAEGETIPAGLYILSQYAALAEAQQTSGYDSSLKNIWDNKLENKSLKNWVNDRALELVKQYAEVEKEFKAEGLELDEDTIKEVDNTVESNWASVESLYTAIGVAKESYRSYLLNQQKYYEIFDAYYGEGGKEEISDDSLTAHYQENYAQFKAISFSKTDSAGKDLDASALVELKNKADQYLERAKAGEDFDELIAQRKKEISTDTSDTEEEEDQEVNNMIMIKKDEASWYVSNKLSNAVFEEAEIGEPILLSDDNAYYVVLRYNVTDDEETYQKMRQSVLLDLKQDDFDEMLMTNAKSLDFTLNESAAKRYDPKKIEKEQKKAAQTQS